MNKNNNFDHKVIRQSFVKLLAGTLGGSTESKNVLFPNRTRCP
jgi:hypothetical protein